MYLVHVVSSLFCRTHQAEFVHGQLVEVDGLLASLFHVFDTGLKAVSVARGR